MKITVNGNDHTISAGTNLKDLINSLNYDIRLIAVELNGVIPPKAEYSSTILNENDTVEIVAFMGGG